MDTYTVEGADEYVFPGGGKGWSLTLQKSDGKRGAYIFPSEAFEWRAAEYDLDPTDKDTLLDIILHEPFAGVSPNSVSSDPAFTEGGLSVERTTNRGTRKVGDSAPVTLMNAETIEDARAAMLLRIQHGKRTRAVVKDSLAAGKAKSPLTKVKDSMNIDLDAVEEKKRFVTLRRKAIRGRLSQQEAKDMQSLDRIVNRKVR